MKKDEISFVAKIERFLFIATAVFFSLLVASIIYHSSPYFQYESETKKALITGMAESGPEVFCLLITYLIFRRLRIAQTQKNAPR